MATLAEIRAHQVALGDLTTLTRAALVAFWRTLDLSDPVAVAVALREFMPEAFATYGSAAATLAADFYDDLRAEALVAASFTATVVDAPSAETAQSLVGWGLAPLFQQAAPVDPALALSRLSGGLQRAIAGADRQTIITNARNDPAAVRYARHASANACAFCAMLATRQAVFRSEKSAVRVVGRGTAKRGDGSKMDVRRKGVKPRGTRALGEKFHDDCHCVAVPVWPGQEIPEAPYVADWREAYFAATDELGGARDTKAILAKMRDSLGTN